MQLRGGARTRTQACMLMAHLACMHCGMLPCLWVLCTTNKLVCPSARPLQSLCTACVWPLALLLSGGHTLCALCDAAALRKRQDLGALL